MRKVIKNSYQEIIRLEDLSYDQSFVGVFSSMYDEKYSMCGNGVLSVEKYFLINRDFIICREFVGDFKLVCSQLMNEGYDIYEFSTRDELADWLKEDW